MFDLPTFKDIGKAFTDVATETMEQAKKAGESVIEGTKRTGQAIGNFVGENKHEIVNGVATVAQGDEDTRKESDPSSLGHPDMGGGTRTEQDLE